MLPVVVTTGLICADLARPVSQEEYARVMLQETVWHEPLGEEARDYYLARGRVLAGFLRPGMTAEEVHRILGIRASGWVQEGDRWTHT
jgi:hypothetical protein